MSWREQTRLSQRLFEKTRESLALAMTRGLHDWPLPEPPLSDPEFPVIPPSNPEKLNAIASALLEANRAAFDRDLEVIGESLIPHRLSLTADPERESRKWLERRADEVAERALYMRLEIMLSQALDRDAPDVDRWWVAISLLNGLSANDSAISRQQGYYLMESIALAEKPGNWHGSVTPGPHLMDWSEGRSVETPVQQSHPRGVFAAGWLLDRMEEADPPRPVLVEWLDLALARGTLVQPLSILPRLNRMVGDGDDELACRIAALLPRSYDFDFEGALQLEKTLLSREANVRTALAGELDEIIRRRGIASFDLLDSLLDDSAVEVVQVATNALRLCQAIDSTGFTRRCIQISKHPGLRVRRQFAQAVLRDYIEHNPSDEAGITISLWLDNDEIIRSRLRELLLHMTDSYPDELLSILNRIIAIGGQESLSDFWRVLSVRSEELAVFWRSQLNS